jgi:hypothetical protein
MEMWLSGLYSTRYNWKQFWCGLAWSVLFTSSVASRLRTDVLDSVLQVIFMLSCYGTFLYILLKWNEYILVFFSTPMFCKSALGWIDCVLYVCIGVNYSASSHAVSFFKLTIGLMGERGACNFTAVFSASTTLLLLLYVHMFPFCMEWLSF